MEGCFLPRSIPERLNTPILQANTRPAAGKTKEEPRHPAHRVVLLAYQQRFPLLASGAPRRGLHRQPHRNIASLQTQRRRVKQPPFGASRGEEINTQMNIATGLHTTAYCRVVELEPKCKTLNGKLCQVLELSSKVLSHIC